MPKRTPIEPEDKLREEYFRLLPEVSRLADQLSAEMQYHTLPIARRLGKHEQLVVKVRVKQCGSAIDKLRRKQEGGQFDRDNPENYTLTSLNDLAAARLLVFPRSLMQEVDSLLLPHFSDWKPEHIRNKETDQLLALKYCGLRPDVSKNIRGEYQIASMLTGLFWEVEHDAHYKLDPLLKSAVGDREMNKRENEVYQALTAFEDQFEKLISAKDRNNPD